MNSRKTILVLEFTHSSKAEPGVMAQKGISALREKAEVDWLPVLYPVTEENKQEIRAHMAKGDAVVLAPWHQFPFSISADQIGACPNLKVIAGTFDNRFAAWVDI